MTMNKKFKFKMPSAYTVLVFIIIMIGILTWFIPSGHYAMDKAGRIIAGTYQQTGYRPQGIWDICMAPIIGMIGNKYTDGAISISLFILVIGGFLGVVNKTEALDKGINQIVYKLQGREKALIIILMILFSIGGTTFGMGEETIAFYPLLIPVMMKVGFDSLTAVGIALIGTQIGCLASTVNPFATGVASQTINISMGDGLFSRILLLVLFDVISITFVYRYATKIKKDPTKSLVYGQREADQKRFLQGFDENQAAETEKLTKAQKRVLFIFCLTFVLMIIALIPWSSINPNFTFWDQSVKWLTGIPFLGKLLGTDIVPFGSWYFNEITMLFIVMSVVIMFVTHMKESEFIEAFMNGMSELLSVAIIVAVARGIQVIMNDAAITDTVLHWGEMGLKSLPKTVFIILTYLFYIPMSFLIPSTSGLASATMGILGPMANFAHVAESTVVTAFQAASGWVNLITPTSGIVVGALGIAHVNITVWWKWMAKLMVVLLIATCVYLAVLAII